jgi:methyltransferase (TIGR00027 family)
MEEAQVRHIGTALLAAYVRAYHAMHDPPKIFDDLLGYSLIPEEWRALLEQGLVSSLHLYDPELAASCPDQATALAQVMRAMAPGPPMTLGRSRYTEESLEKAVSQGVKQYVILGAGMDTFAFRRPDMLEQLQMFEVDHPATQTFKRRRLAELGWEQPAQLHFVPVDFTQESLAAALTRSSYDPQAPSFFSWLGVTYYLPRDAVFATLRAITNVAPAGSAVIFDYLDTDAFVPERAAKRVQVMLESFRQQGVPLITGFDPSTLTADLANLGLRLYEDLSPTDIQERYFQGRTDGYYACEHEHYAWIVVE